jgi:hypothetical protein
MRRALNGNNRKGKDGSGSWPTDMAFALMKNAGIGDSIHREHPRNGEHFLRRGFPGFRGVQGMVLFVQP